MSFMTMSTCKPKLCLYMTLLTQDIHIQFRFNYFYNFHQFKSILFVYQPMKNSNFQTRESLFTFFCFAPCVPLLNHHSTHMNTTSSFECRFICHLFERVVLLPLSVPLCFEPCLCPPSSCFVQRAAAFHCPTVLVDPHVYIYTFPSSFVALPALESAI